MILSSLEETLCSYVDREAPRLIEIIRDLVRIPSENTPPTGGELACQQHVADVLQKAGWNPDLYSLAEVPGLREHPMFFGNRDYTNRPNVGARKNGSNGGRSLVLSGHIDTVPSGTQPWTRDPFSGDVVGNRLFGRGSNDMKAGVGTSLFIVEALTKLGLNLKGDLIFESVVDEEFGGVNGTLAGRLRGYNGDAAIISEPSFLRICPAQRGGRLAHIFLEGSGGILGMDRFPVGVIDQLTYLLVKVKEFAANRREKARVHELYRQHADPVPVAIMKVFTAPWGTKEPVTPPEQCQIEMFWQTMPGETQPEIEGEFFAWLDSAVAGSGGLLEKRPEVTFPIRWLPGSAISKSEPLVKELADCAKRVLGEEPEIVGLEAPCDMYVFHQGFDIPAVLWGGKGGNTHAADEYLEIDSVIDAAKTLLMFVCRWCGVPEC